MKDFEQSIQNFSCFYPYLTTLSHSGSKVLEVIVTLVHFDAILINNTLSNLVNE